MRLHKKYVMPLYIAIQMLYFLLSALLCSYMTIYLLDRGLNVREVGILIGVNYALSVPLQPLFAAWIVKRRRNLSRCVSAMSLCIAALALALLLLPMGKLTFALTVLIICLMANIGESAINSLYRGYHDRGIKMNYSLARGMGSAMYSFTTLVVGMYLRKLAPAVLPAFYIAPAVLLSICLWIFNAPAVESEKQPAGNPKDKTILKDYPHFALLLAGVALIVAAHSFEQIYMVQIMQRLGGDSAHLGIALAIAAITELPAMVLYKRIYKRFGNRRLMLIAGWTWVLKNIIIAIAPSTYVIYAASLLQFMSYAIYVPTVSKHVAHALPPSLYLKGVALIGSAFVCGSLIASVLGGVLIDAFGIKVALLAIQCLPLVGIVFYTKSIQTSLKLIPAAQRES